MEMRDVVDHFIVPFSGDVALNYQRILQRPVHFLWEPIQDWRFRRPKEMNSGPIVFVGNQYEHLPGNEIRSELCTFIKSRVPELELYGNIAGSKGEIPYTNVPDLYNNAYIVICENNHHDVDNYFTPRNIGAMAAGSCSLHRTFPGIDKVFEGLDLGYHYNHKYELLQAINFLKHNPEIRNRIAVSSHKYARNNFNTSAWGEELIQILNKL
jgi:hypothetical protein